MTTFFTGAALVVGVLIVLGLVQGVRGPTVFDRVIAAALAAANGIVLLLLIGFLFERVDMFVDIAIAYAMLAFLFPIALGKYFERFGGNPGPPPASRTDDGEGRR